MSEEFSAPKKPQQIQDMYIPFRGAGQVPSLKVSQICQQWPHCFGLKWGRILWKWSMDYGEDPEKALAKCQNWGISAKKSCRWCMEPACKWNVLQWAKLEEQNQISLLRLHIELQDLDFAMLGFGLFWVQYFSSFLQSSQFECNIYIYILWHCMLKLWNFILFVQVTTIKRL